MKKLSLIVLCVLMTALLAVAVSAYDDIQLQGTNTPPVIDGKLDDCYVKIHDFYAPNEDEWYDNEDALHEGRGEAWGTWNAENFYALFKVSEEDYFPQNLEGDPPGSTYSSMYLALLATLPVNDLPENDLYVMQCSYNRSIDETKEWKYTGSVVEQYRDNSGAYAVYDTCPFDFEVINDGQYTYYEVKMPWNQIDRTGEVSFTEGHKWFFNYIITFQADSGYKTLQYGQGLMNDIYDMGGIVTLVAAPGGSAAPAAPAKPAGRANVTKGSDGSLQIPKTDTPITMDGYLDDGYAKLNDFYATDGFRTDYDKQKDIKGSAYTTWDDEMFYLYLEVLTPEYEPIFDVQAIDMGIGPAGYVALLGTADGSYSEDQRFEIGIALADEDIPCWKVSSPSYMKDSSADNFYFDECPYSFGVRRDEETNYLFYEFGIPWTFLDRTDNPIKYTEGSQFVLNYAANVHTTSDYGMGQSHLVEFGGGIWAGSYTDGATVTLVGTAGASSGPAAPAVEAAELLAKSWDTIFVDYETMVDGGAQAWLAENPIEGPIEVLGTRGWAHISTPIKGFAYTIDGGAAVKSADFIQDRPDVKAAIHEEAEGFNIEIEVDKLKPGEHLIKVYAIDANDQLVDTTFDFPFTLEAPPSKGFDSLDAAAAAAGMKPITGYEWEDGTSGNGGEGPENLWDGDTSTKFCTSSFPIESVASLDGVYKVTGFTMATANDNASYNGRSPSGWTVSVSSDGTNWTKLASGSDAFFEELNFTYFNGKGSADGVSYVKFEADGASSGCFQLSEVTLYGERTGDKTDAPPAEETPAETPTAQEPPAENPETKPADEAPAAETPAAEKPAEEKKSGCGSMIGGSVITLIAVLGSAWISKRK
ncbi:MAG: hypothetical protein IKQ92_01110 [Clostridia bacterium]|nr:hypothetical protein [Clostridia bacterium]